MLEPEIVEEAERVGRGLNHNRPIAQIEGEDVIDRVSVGCQEQRLRVHEARPDRDATVVLCANAEEAVVHRLQRHELVGAHVGIERPREVEVVVHLRDGVVRGHTVLERQAAESSVQNVGRDDILRNLGHAVDLLLESCEAACFAYPPSVVL